MVIKSKEKSFSYNNTLFKTSKITDKLKQIASNNKEGIVKLKKKLASRTENLKEK